MILSLKHYRELGFFKAFKITFIGMGYQLLGLVSLAPKKDATGVAASSGVPRLKRNEKGNSFCVSCSLCSSICPTEAIEIQTDSSIQMPRSLTSGPAPKSFHINESLCLQCSLCVEVCPASALAPASL